MPTTNPTATLTPTPCPECGEGKMVIVLLLAPGCYAFGCTNNACAYRACAAELGPHVLRAGMAYRETNTPT